MTPSRDDAYIETRVLTADPHMLHLLVVEGALRNAKRAAMALDEGDVANAHVALCDAREFVSELLGGLDEDRMPETVENVRRLFVFVYRRLLQADVDHEAKLVHDAVRVLEVHRATWMELRDVLVEEAANAATPERVVPAPHLNLDGAAPHDGPREWTT